MNEVALRRRVAVCCSPPKDLRSLPRHLHANRQQRLTDVTAEEREASCRW
jgi:site-specific recombinase XerC